MSGALTRVTLRAGERVAQPLDRARWVLIRALGEVGRKLVRDRELRVVVQGLVFVPFTLATCLLIPMWTLALGPVLLGVPHLISDLRYLVVRPGFHRRLAVVLLAAPFLLAVSLGAGAKIGLLGAVGVLLALPSTAVRRLVVGLGVGAIVGAAWWLGDWADLIFAHAHNWIAMLLWWLWSPGGRRRGWVLFAYGLALVALYGGLADAALTWHDPGIPLNHHRASLAPGFSEVVGGRMVIAFGFAQSMHYAVWLRLMPDEDRPRETPRTFASSWRALAGDVGAPLLLAACVVSVALVFGALVDLSQAHTGYLRLAAFHGSLEVCALVALALGWGGRT